MPRRLIREDTFRLLWIFCFRNRYSKPLSPCYRMCQPGLACADCAGWSGSIHWTESIMLVFSWNGWYIWTMLCYLPFPTYKRYAADNFENMEKLYKCRYICPRSFCLKLHLWPYYRVLNEGSKLVFFQHYLSNYWTLLTLPCDDMFEYPQHGARVSYNDLGDVKYSSF